MENKTIYTAVGHLRKKHDGPGRTYPVIIVNQREYMMDMQELTVWTSLCWRFKDFSRLRDKYEMLSKDLPDSKRTLESCLQRLLTRGLVAVGTGPTYFDALYDLLSSLYVVPILVQLPLRLVTFCKLVFLRGIPYERAKILFARDHRSKEETQVMELSQQALLTTAELIRCIELGVTDISTGEKLMAALYNDTDTTSDNIRFSVQDSKYLIPITIAIANLYLRKQIIFQRH